MKTLVILGTAREDSHTLDAVRKLCPFPEFELVDLARLNIGYYSYLPTKNEGDDFLGIAEKMRLADNIVFATPVYWYAMSGVFKVFLDRLTDLLVTHKAIGKSLQGKRTYLIATGDDAGLPPGFEVPFKMTSEYFKMSFQKSLYLMVR